MVDEQAHTRVFQTKVFARLAKAEGIRAMDLVRSVAEAESGLIDAELGRGLIKQRLARRGQGKSGALRTIMVFRRGDRAIFIDVFAKKDKANFTQHELKGYRQLAGIFLGLSGKQITEALHSGALIEITNTKETADAKEAHQQPARRHP